MKNKIQKSKVFGVIGDPISHSKSPRMHNAALKKIAYPASYFAFHVPPKDLKSFFKLVRSGDISGINITIPHKQAALKLVDQLTPAAHAIGAVNTVYRKGKTLIGHNTDGLGYLESLKSETRFAPNRKRVILIGAGGASLAVAYALCNSGIGSLHIANRDARKARRLAGKLKKYRCKKITSSGLENIPEVTLKSAHLLVNTTSMGMSGIAWPSLDFVKQLPKSALVSDIVYAPKLTPLLSAAKKRKLRCHFGLGMLLHQGALAFKCFTGKSAPVNVMRKALG